MHGNSNIKEVIGVSKERTAFILCVQIKNNGWRWPVGLLKGAERSSGTELFTIRHGVMVLHRIQAQDSAATLATSFRIAKSHMPEHINLYGKNLGSHYLTLMTLYKKTYHIFSNLIRTLFTVSEG